MTDEATQNRKRAKGVDRFIAKAASGTFILRIFYLASGFATTLLLTRWLGAASLGVYNFVISWVVLTVIFVKFGFENYLTREIAAFSGEDNFASVKAVWTFATRFVILTAVIAIAAYAVVLPFVTFENPRVIPTFYLGLAMLPLLAWLGVYKGLFRGTKQIIVSQVPEFLIRPIFLMIVVGLFLLFSLPGRSEYAILINVVGTLIALVFCIARNPHRDRMVTSEKASVSPGVWLAGAFPFMLIAGIHIFNQRTDRLMLGAMLDMEAVGIYSVAIQMSLVVNFPLLGITAAVGPLVAEREKANQQSELQHALIKSTAVATVVAVAIVIALAIFGPYVLMIFGPEFDAAYAPLIVLSLGQLANVAAGPAGAILSMSRHENLVAWGVFSSAILNVILNYCLIPVWGIFGAAMATAISMFCWNFVLVIIAKRKLGISSNLGACLIPASPPKVLAN